MNVVSIVGARPQFVKAFAVSRQLRKSATETLVHTGQHYDEEMSSIFFKELEIPEPDYNLGVGSGSHGEQTASMISQIETVIDQEVPDIVLLYGDTNSTLAGSIAASKMDATLAHVEAGLRSYNRDMPEEINRIVTDTLSDLLFAPSETAVENLREEGITAGVYNTGDVMCDSLVWIQERIDSLPEGVAAVVDDDQEFILATVHRAENTDDREKLQSIFDGLADLPHTVLMPIHPRTRKRLEQLGLYRHYNAEIEIIGPVGYLDFISIMEAATLVVTDSGGAQKEAFFLNTPCVTLRNETEWIETVQLGWNVLVGADADRIREEVATFEVPSTHPNPYGDGTAARAIVSILADNHENGPAE